jgi:hypothetical protein
MAGVAVLRCTGELTIRVTAFAGQVAVFADQGKESVFSTGAARRKAHELWIDSHTYVGYRQRWIAVGQDEWQEEQKPGFLQRVCSRCFVLVN